MSNKLGKGIVSRTSTLIPKDLQARNFRRTSWAETLAHVLKGNIGAGLFAMGDAFKNAGIALGPVGTLVIGIICVYNNHVLVRLAKVVKKRKGMTNHMPTFPEAITYSFELGPPKFRKLCKAVMIIMKTFICITQLGFCVIYISLVGETINLLLEETYDLGLRVCISITFPALLAASLIHTLKFLAPVSIISSILIFYGYAVCAVMSALDLPKISERKLVAPVEQWPLFVGTVIFAFEGIALVIPLRNEMKKPYTFDKYFGPLNVGMSICMVMLNSLGFMGYFKYGEDVKDSVTFNLPDTWVGDSAQATFALGILFTYPLQFYVVVKILMKEVKRKWGPFKRPLLAELILRTILVIVTYIVALTIPYINLLLSLIGAVCSNALALFFPAMADISLRFSPPSEEIPIDESVDIEEESVPEMNKVPFRLAMDAISLLLSVVGTIFGAYIATERIVEKFISEVKEGFD